MRDTDAHPRPANDQRAVSPWAPWNSPALMVWSDMAFASFACWATMQRAWLEAGIGLLNHPSSPVASDDPLLVATARDWRSCGDAMIQAQLETLESWRRAS